MIPSLLDQGSEDERLQHAVEKHSLTTDDCPRCDGRGDLACSACDGKGVLWRMVACDDDACPITRRMRAAKGVS